MIPYWALLLIPTFAALAEAPKRSNRSSDAPWLVLGLLFSLAIGFRYDVGGDWTSYLSHLQATTYISFEEALQRKDPGYVCLNWIVQHLGYDIWAVNLICGMVFSGGLIAFARQQPQPWLAIVVSVPYLVIVVGMGYSRQAVAIGLAMFGLVALARGSVMRFLLCIALAATFHRSAVVLVPIALLAGTEKRIWAALWVAVFGAALYSAFLEDRVEGLVKGYMEAEYNSQGALIRVMMNAVPAAVFLIYRKRFAAGRELKLWTYLSIVAISFIGFLAVSPSSTAVDRMALYLIPIQIFVWSRLPLAFGRRGFANTELLIGVLVYAALVQFVWLNYASHAKYWLPYRTFLDADRA